MAGANRSNEQMNPSRSDIGRLGPVFVPLSRVKWALGVPKQWYARVNKGGNAGDSTRPLREGWVFLFLSISNNGGIADVGCKDFAY